jgi:beta-glucanase (GH16 family)
MWLPCGAGIWPAFWLAGVSGISKTRTTNSIEIDILEAYGVDMTIAHHSVHVWTPHGAQMYATGAADAHAGMITGWHKYACLVNADFIHFYFDDTEVYKIPTPPSALLPLYLMVNLALGGGWPIDIPSPTSMYVDYIRVYAP